jgi:hypothetical protein
MDISSPLGIESVAPFCKSWVGIARSMPEHYFSLMFLQSLSGHVIYVKLVISCFEGEVAKSVVFFGRRRIIRQLAWWTSSVCPPYEDRSLRMEPR